MEVSCYCPFCSSSRKSFRYNTGKDVYYCWRCDRAGKGNPTGVIVVGKEKVRNQVQAVYQCLPDTWLPLSEIPLRKPFRQRAERYLSAHHINIEQSVEEELGMCGPWLTVPIPNARRLRFYVQRDLFSKRFLSAPWPKEGIVYQRGIRSEGHVFLVESAFSAIRMERFGHTLAALGSTVTPEQCDRIAYICKGRKLIILLDADVPDKATRAWQQLKRRNVRAVVARLPYGDPCDFEDHNLGEVINAFA